MEFKTTLTGYSFDKKTRDKMEKDFLDCKETSSDYDFDAIEKQRAIGIDLPSISMNHMYPDEIGYLALSMKGFELNFGTDGQGSKTTTNQYLSIPRIVSDVSHRKHFTPSYGKDVKVIMTGPLTLALRSNNQHYDDFDELIYAITMAYHAEINHLQEKGVKNIQFNEYGIFSNPSKDNLDRLVRIYSCLDYPAIKKFIAFYFGNPSVIIPIADRINADVLHFDVFEHENYLSLIRNVEKLKGKEVVLGLLDSLQYTNDDMDQALIKAADFSDSFGPENTWISANGDLTIRGPKFAEAKAKNLVSIAKNLRCL